MGKDGRANNGFLDRLLFSWPEGLKKPKWTDDELNLELLGAYEAAINRLLALGFDEENKAHRLTLSPQAKKRLFKFFNEENKPLCDEAPGELLQGLHGKFDIHTARLIIPLHLLAWAYGEGPEAPPLEVSLETVERAIRGAEFFRSQSLKVYRALHESSPADKLPKDRRKVYEALPETFKTGDGVAIAEGLGMKDKTFRNWLRAEAGTLFLQPEKYGPWQKFY
jgi:hypothetical protein